MWSIYSQSIYVLIASMILAVMANPTNNPAAMHRPSSQQPKLVVEIEGTRGDFFIPYAVHDELRNGRARYEDPFGGCRLRCPHGFNPADYHIHMHKWNRKAQKGGRDPVHGIWHQDFMGRAD